MRGWHLGGLLISAVDFDSQRFVRDRRKTVVDGLDHYLVQLYATGGLIGEAGDRGRVLHGGDVQILDLTQSNVTQAAPSGTVAIVVPRETLDQALPAPGDLHGLILRGQSGMGGLLADYMRSLVARADSMTVAEAPLVAQATTDMIVACFQSTAETTERARAAIDQTMRQRIQRHITAHLESPALQYRSAVRPVPHLAQPALPAVRAVGRRRALHPGAAAHPRLRRAVQSGARPSPHLRDRLRAGLLERGAFQPRLPLDLWPEPKRRAGARTGHPCRCEPAGVDRRPERRLRGPGFAS